MDRIQTASMRALRGESAYDIAVKNGFVGTEEEWLATLGRLGGAVSSVNTRTGAVVLAKSDVGLANVNNTSDLAKPISTAAQTALDAKLATTAAPQLIRDTVATGGTDGDTLTRVAGAPAWRRPGVLDPTHPVFGGEDANGWLTAINTAAAAASVLTRGVVFFPEQVLEILPTTTRGIDLYSNVTYEGAGPGSCIKVRADAGNYSSVFRPQTVSARLTNVTIHSLRIDQNAAAQTVATAPLGSGIDYCQFAIAAWNARDITVRGVHFHTCTGLNTVYLNGGGFVDAGDFWVEGCTFRFRPLPNAANPNTLYRTYDNSAIYLNGERAHVTNNTFVAAILDSGFAACEFHGPVMIFMGNIVDGYQTVINLGIGTSRSSASWRVTNNIGRNLNRSVTVQAKTGTNNDRIVVTDNEFQMSTADHNLHQGWGVNLIYDSANGTGNVVGVDISRNLIVFMPDSRTTSWTGATLSVAAWFVGIGVTAGGTISQGTVNDNIIINAPLIGMKIGNDNPLNTLFGFEAKRNRIVDAGHMTWLNGGDRWYLWLAGNLTDVDIDETTFLDTRTAPVAARRAIYAPASGLGTVVETWVRRSRLLLTNATPGSWSTSAANIDTTKVSREFARATIDPASIAAGGESVHTITMTGAKTGDVVTAVPNAGLENGLSFFAFVSAANTVTLHIRNHTAAAIDPVSRIWRFRLHRTEQDV